MNRDSIQELLQVIVRNPIRTLLASIGVAWGIMMLILMVGAGNGLENGVKQEMEGIAQNSLALWGQSTTMPFKGFDSGRWVNLNTSDVEYLKTRVPEIAIVAPRNQLGGWRGSNNVTRGTKTGAFNVNGDIPEFQLIEPVNITQGRFINQGDINDYRKICVIGTMVANVLFEKDELPLGQYITINGVNFLVVGVFKSSKTGEDSEEDNQSIYIPFTTFGRAFHMGDYVDWVSLLSADGYSVEQMTDATMAALKTRKSVHPDDKRAFGYWSMKERMDEMNLIFDAFDIVGFSIGFLVLLAGIIGIVNIMLITVKERTKEFGVRRSIGARPMQVIFQVMKETLFLTIIAGMVGMMLGVGLLELVSAMTAGGGDTGSFKNPGVDYRLVGTALLVMIASGAVAGLLPAMRAVAIRPVDALRADG